MATPETNVTAFQPLDMLEIFQPVSALLASAKTIPLTNSEFTVAVFRDLPPGAHPLFTTFDHPPSSKGWVVQVEPPANLGANNYTVVSSFKADKRRANRKDFGALHCVFTDDLYQDGTDHRGTGMIELGTLKLPLSWVMASSPGNYQGGYILEEPILDLAFAKWFYDKLVKAIAANAGIDLDSKELKSKAQGMLSVTRNFRAPEGANNKRAVVKANGGEPFQHQVKVWQPELRYSVDALAQAYGIDLAEYTAPARKTKAATPADPENSIEFFAARTVLYNFMLENGWLTGDTKEVEDKADRKSTLHQMNKCVRGHLHTQDAQRDTGTGCIIPMPGDETDSLGYQCFHRSCEGSFGGDEFLQWALAKGYDQGLEVLGWFVKVGEDAPEKTIEDLAPAQLPEPLAQDGKFYVPPRPQGLAGAIFDYAMATAPRQQPTIALAAALHVLGMVSANGYAAPGGIRLNIYTKNVLLTAAGKDHLHKVVSTVLDSVSRGDGVYHAMASGPALLKSLARHNPLFLWEDESWQLIEANNSDRGSEHRKSLLKELLTMHSGAGNIHGRGGYANAKDALDRLEYPFLCFGSATTPEKLMKVTSSDQIADGFFNRMTIFQSDDMPPAVDPFKRKAGFAEVPQSIKDALAKFPRDMSYEDLDTDDDSKPERDPADQVNRQDPILLDHDQEAADLQDRFNEEARQHSAQGGMGALWGRAHVQAIKIAGIIALGMPDKVITGSIMKYAIDMVRGTIKDLTRTLSTQMFESRHDEVAKTILATVAGQGKRKLHPRTKQHKELLAKGWVPLGVLTQALNMDTQERDKGIKFLRESGQLLTDQVKGNTKKVHVYALPGADKAE